MTRVLVVGGRRGECLEPGLVSPETMADLLQMPEAMLLATVPTWELGVAMGETEEVPVTMVSGLEAFNRSGKSAMLRWDGWMLAAAAAAWWEGWKGTADGGGAAADTGLEEVRMT